MRLRFFRICLLLALTAAFRTPAQATPPGPATTAAADEEMINGIKLADAPLDAVLQLLESWTGRTILRPQALPSANYTLNINRPLPKSEAVRAIETLMGLNGIGVAPLGDRFLKVIPLAQTRTEAPLFISGSALDLPPSGRVASKLFQLQFLRVNELIPQIQQILSPGVASPPMLFEAANAALITDTITNLQRIELLVQKLDKPATDKLEPKFYPLHFAKASEVVAKLHTIFQGPLQSELGTATSYNADDRTNQIIVITDPRQYALFDGLIAKLDIKADPNTRNEVIYLKHAAAKDVASLLSQLISGQTSVAQKTGQTSPRPIEQPYQSAPNQPGQPPRPSTNVTLASLGLNKEEASTQFSGLVTVVPDDRSNSVVVSGTMDDIRLIKEVVDKVDILLAQVSIEVVIAEVTLNDTDQSGINALNLTIGTDTPDNNGHRGTHITNFDTANANGPSGVAGWNITSGVVNPLSFQAALSNTGSKSNVKVLSSNTIVTTHNKEAEFIVSQQQPIITGTTSTPVATTTTTNSGFSTSSTVTYKDIGIDVKVTPLIGDDGSIQLQIDQKVDDIVGNVTIDGNPQPIIGHREATAFINVQDNQMIVLGGLQQTKNSASRTKLGFLYEIPIISNLLGARTNSVDRTELLLFIRPHVIPVNQGTQVTNQHIEDLSNKDQVKQYLQDPAKKYKESLLDKYYR